MILLNPFALLYALAIGLLLLLHLRRPRRTQRVSNLQLWQAVAESPARRPILELIRRNLLLILQILFLTTVVLAMARPAIRFWSAPPRFVVLVFDCSASMAAREGGKTRFDLAREKALALVSDVGGNDRVTLIQARPQPLVNSYAGSDTGALRRALNSMSPTEAPVDISAAVILALSSVDKTEPYEVFLFSDGTQAAKISGIPVYERIHYVQTGQSDNNVAITRFSVRNNPFSVYDQQIFAEIVNFSDRPQDFRFDVAFEDKSLLSEPVKLGSHERKTFVAAPPAGSEGVIRATIDAKDDLAADNRAYAVLSPRKMQVLLVSDGNVFLEKALLVNPQVSCTIKKPQECSPEEFRRGFDVVILDGLEPADLPPANYFILSHPTGRATLRSIGNLISLRPAHPVTTFLDLSNITVDQAVALDVPPSGTALIEGAGKPLIVASETGAFRTVKVGFDIRSSNMPLTPSFPVLVSNVLHWLSSATGDAGNQIAAGTLFQWRVPAGEPSTEVSVRTPAGLVAKGTVVDGTASFPGTEATGIYTIQCSSAVARFAVNLLDESESNIKPVSGAMNGVGPISKPELARAGREVWPVLLVMALLFLVLEWFHYLKPATGRMKPRTSRGNETPPAGRVVSGSPPEGGQRIERRGRLKTRGVT